MDKSFYKAVLAIALPVSMQGLISVGVNMMDTVMLGQLGETALSASSLANQFIGVFQILCTGIGMGSSIMTARFWGAKDHDSTKKAVMELSIFVQCLNPQNYAASANGCSRCLL